MYSLTRVPKQPRDIRWNVSWHMQCLLIALTNIWPTFLIPLNIFMCPSPNYPMSSATPSAAFQFVHRAHSSHSLAIRTGWCTQITNACTTKVKFMFFLKRNISQASRRHIKINIRDTFNHKGTNLRFLLGKKKYMVARICSEITTVTRFGFIWPIIRERNTETIEQRKTRHLRSRVV